MPLLLSPARGLVSLKGCRCAARLCWRTFPAGSAANVRQHKRAAQRQPFNETNPRAGESRSGILNQTHIAALVVCDPPTILFRAIAATVTCQYVERQVDGRGYAARHGEKFAHHSSPISALGQ